jgi:hypothetical protein
MADAVETGAADAAPLQRSAQQAMAMTGAGAGAVQVQDAVGGGADELVALEHDAVERHFKINDGRHARSVADPSSFVKPRKKFSGLTLMYKSVIKYLKETYLTIK